MLIVIFLFLNLQIILHVVFPQLPTKMAVKTPITLVPDRSAPLSVEADLVVAPMEMEAFLLVPEGTKIEA